MADTVALPAGWVALADRGQRPGAADGLVRGRHPVLPVSLVVQVRPVTPDCDPRGVAARLITTAARSDALVEYRQWGRFGEREVALQVVRVGGSTVLHAVWVDDAPAGLRCVVVAVTAPPAQAEAAGTAFAEVVAELSARSW